MPLIEQAAELLPAQGPITAFVHHNTLHAFEGLPFGEAVLKGAETFGCHPYLPEERYRTKLAGGRIRSEDIEAVLIDELGESGDTLLGFLGTRLHLQLAILAHPLLSGPTSELRWVVAETDALRKFRDETPRQTRDHVIADTRDWVTRGLRNEDHSSADDQRLRVFLDRVLDRFDNRGIEQWDDGNWEAFTLHAMWLASRDGVERADIEPQEHVRPRRHRDLLLQATGQDSDHLVHDILIRYCAAFIDQGFSEWRIPHRDAGFYLAFLAEYQQPFGPMVRWMHGLREELQRLSDAKIGPLESIAESLELLGVEEDEHEEFIATTLLALRGYAGMIWQLELRGDRVAQPIPSGSLAEFLAIHLILDRTALGHVAKDYLAYRGPLSELRAVASGRIPEREAVSVEQRTFLVFQLAQYIGWKPEVMYRLADAEWTLLLREMDSFSSLQRRRIYHLAFERRYRIQTLNAVAIHSCRTRPARTDEAATDACRPTFQVVRCIDEREESFRRHLEEGTPDCETFGAAGFFAIAIFYRGAADAHFTPLCPVIIKPRHYIVENVVYSLEKT